ncbi:Salicylic acid-binding protein 2 [Linum perenne]
MTEQTSPKTAHFVLVHGACHGAWCWFKLKPLLETAGHRVTVFDLAASGIDTKSIHQVPTLRQYTQPLLDFLSAIDEKSEDSVILVGHSLGGLNLALAMECFPNKISAAVFLSAFMPDTAHSPSFVLEQYSAKAPPGAWMDTDFTPANPSENEFQTMTFGHEFLAVRLYQLCTKEDLELAKTLVRPSSLFLNDLSRADKFTEAGYGSVRRVYVNCDKDKAINVEFQKWMIKNYDVDQVMEIKDADHMSMLSQPIKVCDCLSKIAAA